ncbi:hypothetical protein F4778DRAFT_189971 [Xylariomycetidae sp. FL2044]|nr:hypothetical protein F4778DRAFT_189971 [Xylariomycetidae sp. FL2044]
MAEGQKSIEAILAALGSYGTAPRAPSTTPSQAQQPHAMPPYQQASTPSAYPPAMPPSAQQPNSYAPPAYLPQHAAGGNFDLSAIRPVTSGTVQFADALSQAKAYAAEKGLQSYERPPPGSYQSSGPGQYRSRSRSPPARRDGAYRDNRNPYRDERRDDRASHARGDYGRDRSMSPGYNRGRPSGTFSPRGANGRDRGDENSQTIPVESNLVGLIIGRQGENLRRVESETGCRVQFITSSEPGPVRECKITGPRAGREEAIASIHRIIEDSGMGAIARAGLDKQQAPRGVPAGAQAGAPPAALRDGEECMQIMVPDRTVGLIIGRGGETIRDLQERSGCHINIVGESKSVQGLRPVNLIGSPEAAAQAKELILEIVDSDNRNVGGNNNTNKQQMPRNDYAPQEKVNDSIYVPSEAVGMIIGKGGETIREMQNMTGCKINVSQASGPGEVEREIGLVGSHEAISRAKRAIEDKVDAVRQKNSGGGGRGGYGGGHGGRNHNRRDWDNPNYTPQGSASQPSAPETPAGGVAAPAAGDADPYAPYGGYQAYMALWYQAYAQSQAGNQQPPRDRPQPPGA